MTIRTRIDAMLSALQSCEFVVEEDVAWVAITQEELKSIPARSFVCPVRHVDCVKYRGIEFRVSAWAKAGHRPYPVWNMTKRTKDMTNKPGCPQSNFKKMDW